MTYNKLNSKLASLATGGFTLPQFLEACHAIDDPRLHAALEGIYCGVDGRMSEPYDDRHLLIVTWHNKKVEVAYVS